MARSGHVAVPTLSSAIVFLLEMRGYWMRLVDITLASPLLLNHVNYKIRLE